MSAGAQPLGPGPGPLTLGTAGHVDHGKTALVRALTGVETDRLPEERSRGLTIVLGYAPLALPSGRPVSLVDVPGHERFVRTMVSGATGIDGFLMAVAADDGVMPQTAEHAAVLAALGIDRGVIAITKADLAAPERAAREAAELIPGCPVIACSAQTGEGIEQLRAALLELTARLPSRAADAGAPARLHVDRSFSVAGRGTVLTGTLWSGEIARGATLELLRLRGGRARVRVRAVQVHDRPLERAGAGQRVAVNVVGVGAREAGRGDVLLTPGFAQEAQTLDCTLRLSGARHGERVQVHHGTRDAPARISLLEDDLWQLRLERPLVALDGDRLVVRRLAPPDTLGGGRVLDALARRHGARPEILQRLRSIRDGRDLEATAAEVMAAPVRTPGEASTAGGESSGPDVAPERLAQLERRLLEAGAAMLSEARLQDDLPALRVLRRDGRAVRVSGRLYAHAEVVASLRSQIVELLRERGSVTLAGVRDALGLSRKSAQAFLEHLDSERLTRRMTDDSRVLLGRRGAGARAADPTATLPR